MHGDITSLNVEVNQAVSEIRKLIDAGQWFLAYDAAQAAVAKWPGNPTLQRYSAQALLKLGATDEARKALEAICKPMDVDDPEFVHLFHQLRTAAGHLVGASSSRAPSRESLDMLTDLFDVVAKSQSRLSAARAADVDTIVLLAGAYKDAWEETGRIEDARKCRDTYLQAFRQARAVHSCINVASMSWIIGEMDPAEREKDKELARGMALRALELVDREYAASQGEQRFWLSVARGEAMLNLGRSAEASAAYEQAARESVQNDAIRADAVRQLRLLMRHGLRVPESVLQCLKLPVVAIFVGHMIDQPDRQTPRFPAELENEVRRRIDHCLADLDVRIGYSMPACGSDLLFLEALQDRDGEVNIVVPFDLDDFIQTSVAFAGRQWVRRLRRALTLAGNNVTYATTEKFLASPDLFVYADSILHGLATLRARSLGTSPHLVAVYDGVSPTLKGGSADVIRRWFDKEYLRIIEMPKPTVSRTVSPAGGAVGPAPASPAPASSPAVTPQVPQVPRVVRAMLFADVVGFSKIHEDSVPHFMYTFLQQVAAQLNQLPVQPLRLNTWGDAIFAVMETALPMVDYALTLQKVVCSTDWVALGLPDQMSIRIGLHAGPVFEGNDPITGRPNYYGSHVNRAARIEPVTVPGHVYASQQFVALLTSELRPVSCDPRDPNCQWPFACDYLGRLNLAKNFGIIPVYRIRGTSSTHG
jgi:class 3 adenylate cyclase/tetratricopeptide (TPR) repeat protein